MHSYLVDCVHPALSKLPAFLSRNIRQCPCNLLDHYPHEICLLLATDVHGVLGSVDEDDVDIKRWEAAGDVQRCNGRGEGQALGRCECCGVGEDPPERHGRICER